MKKMVSSLKRRGSKVFGRRASQSSVPSGSPARPSSPSPPSSLRSRSRSRSPSPTRRPAPTRARTTSFGFSSLRLGPSVSRKPLLKSASSTRIPSHVHSHSRSRSQSESISSAQSVQSHSETAVGSDTHSLTKKLSLDMDLPALVPVQRDLHTLVSAIEETDRDDHVPGPDPFVVDEPANEPVDAPSVPEIVEPAPEPESEVAAPNDEPAPVAEAEIVLGTSTTPSPEPEPSIEAEIIAVAPEPIATAVVEPQVPAPPTPRTPGPAPIVSSDTSSDSEDEYPELPSLVLPTMFLPIPNVRSLFSSLFSFAPKAPCIQRPPFMTLHWWLHPLVPLV